MTKSEQERKLAQIAKLNAGEVTTFFHPAEIIQEEMDARGWDDIELATRMGGEPIMSLLMIQMYLAVGKNHDPRLRLGDEMADMLSLAFGISAQYFLNIEAAFLAGDLHDGPRE